MLDLVWRPRAHLDRQSIAIYLAVECDAPQAALAAMNSIDAALDLARRFPDAGGHFHHDNLEREYRSVHAGAYTIYYRFDKAKLVVYRILHQRQDIDTYTLTEF